MPDAKVADLVHDRLARVAHAFFEHDPGSTGDFGCDGVHDARVALRRARSYLRTFARLFNHGQALSIRADLKWYAAYLGSVRDLDVIAGRLTVCAERFPDRPGWRAIAELLDEQRSIAVARLLDAQGVARYEKVLTHVRLLADAPLDSSGRATLAELLQRPWHDFRASLRQMERTATEIQLHEVRIRAKDLRYAGEVAAGAIEPEATALSAAAARLQDRVGDHRDTLSAAHFVEMQSSGLGDGAFLAGMLAVALHDDADGDLAGLRRDVRRLRRAYQRLRRELR